MNLDWNNRTTIDKIGLLATFIFLFIIITFFLSISLLATIILALFIYAKRERIKLTITKKGFGTGMIIYTVWLLIGLLLLNSDKHIIDKLFLYVPIIIIGMLVIPIFSKKARIAAPFVLFLCSIGFLFLKLENNASASDSSDSYIDDTSSSDPFTTDTTSTETNTFVSETSTANEIHIETSTSTIVGTDTFADNNNLSNNITQNHQNVTSSSESSNLSFNSTPFETFTDNTSNDVKESLQISSADYNNKVNMTLDSNGNGNITSPIEGNIGTVSTDENNTTIKDNFGNTISKIDNNVGFVYDENGKPVSLIDNNGDIVTVQDVKTGEIKTEANGTVWSGDGKIESHITKK